MIARIADNSELRKSCICRCLPQIRLTRSPADEVRTAVPRFQSCRINGCQSHTLSASHDALDSRREQAIDIRKPKQTPGRLLKSREMRDGFQIDGFRQAVAVIQDCDDASVIGLEKRLQNQTRQQLRKGEFLRTESVAVRWKNLSADVKSNQKYLPWRLRCHAHANLIPSTISPQQDLFYRALPPPFMATPTGCAYGKMLIDSRIELRTSRNRSDSLPDLLELNEDKNAG